MTSINVYPYIKKVIRMVKAQYRIITYEPFVKCDIAVQLFDENDIPVETRIYTMDMTNGLAEWGADDTYLTTWIKEKLQE